MNVFIKVKKLLFQKLYSLFIQLIDLNTELDKME